MVLVPTPRVFLRVLRFSSLRARKILPSIGVGGGGGGAQAGIFLPYVSDKYRSLSCIWLMKKRFLFNDLISHIKTWPLSSGKEANRRRSSNVR